MSDLVGGSSARASNGGPRTVGPVSAARTDPAQAGIRTPRDIIRDRNAREARRQEQQQQQQEEQRRIEEEQRRHGERRLTATAPAPPRVSNTSSQYSADISARLSGEDAPGDRRSRLSGTVAGAEALGELPSRTVQDTAGTRPRGSSLPQPGQSRQSQAPPAATTGARRVQSGQPTPRQPPPAAATGGAPPTSGQPPGTAATAAAATTTGGGQQRTTTSSFPHAFERWETLSSHWEGMTSFWLHKLEQNTDEIRETVPTASTLSRQITDLSAAGANLFHAVVELQRLRASSERKFQRWFFETRADNERNREIQAELERQLTAERAAREENTQNRAKESTTVKTAMQEVMEMRRELMISKDEARRAWEELGRRNQESLDTAQSLKEGRVTLVSGVQVVPYAGGPSRTGSASQRPHTRDSQQAYGSTGLGGLTTQDERQYYREGPSPTITDPFTDNRNPPPTLLQDVSSQSLAAGTYRPQPPSNPGAGLDYLQRGVQPPAGGSGVPANRTDPERFYQQAASTTRTDPERFYQQAATTTSPGPLHPPLSTSSRQHHAPTAAQTAPSHPEGHSEGSYPDTAGSSSEVHEYVIDPDGTIRRDTNGRAVVYRRRAPVRSSESGDELDPENEAIRREREREFTSRYGAEALLPEAPTVPTSSAAAAAAATARAARPDYEGSDFEGWEETHPMRPTPHHHPTRLSDVLEEEDERSSRRTGVE